MVATAPAARDSRPAVHGIDSAGRHRPQNLACHQVMDVAAVPTTTPQATGTMAWVVVRRPPPHCSALHHALKRLRVRRWMACLPL